MKFNFFYPNDKLNFLVILSIVKKWNFKYLKQDLPTLKQGSTSPPFYVQFYINPSEKQLFYEYIFLCSFRQTVFGKIGEIVVKLTHDFIGTKIILISFDSRSNCQLKYKLQNVCFSCDSLPNEIDRHTKADLHRQFILPTINYTYVRFLNLTQASSIAIPFFRLSALLSTDG